MAEWPTCRWCGHEHDPADRCPREINRELEPDVEPEREMEVGW